MKFIYFCAAVLIFSFTALPIFYGISNERNEILASNIEQETTPTDNSISFKEMYAIASKGQGEALDPYSLNDITPAAGQDSNDFPSSFSGISDAALTDDPIIQENIEQEIEN